MNSEVKVVILSIIITYVLDYLDVFKQLNKTIKIKDDMSMMALKITVIIGTVYLVNKFTKRTIEGLEEKKTMQDVVSGLLNMITKNGESALTKLPEYLEENKEIIKFAKMYEKSPTCVNIIFRNPSKETVYNDINEISKCITMRLTDPDCGVNNDDPECVIFYILKRFKHLGKIGRKKEAVMNQIEKEYLGTELSVKTLFVKLLVRINLLTEMSVDNRDELKTTIELVLFINNTENILLDHEKQNLMRCKEFLDGN